MTTSALEIAPPPWTLKGTIYTFTTYTSSSSASVLSASPHLYSPLEASSDFSSGKFIGGLGVVQLIRYTESPVGPYDELLIVPGKYEYELEAGDGKKRDLRLTRIYVSQKLTCYNGRKNWNIPKHLATFKFSTPSPGDTSSISISVTPNDTDDSLETTPGSSTKPFFTATFRPLPYIPRMPVSTEPLQWMGLGMLLVQPPLPQGVSDGGELVGTEEWVSVLPQLRGGARLGWWDLGGDGEREGLWERMGKWKLGCVLEGATIDFPKGVRMGMAKL